jgi:SAM-dependent methyltransferase
MSLDDQERWDRQYAERAASERPAAFLQRILDSGHWEIPTGRALEIACGSGRNALFLAARGFQVDAVDISPIGLDQAAARAREMSLSISWQRADLQSVALPEAVYDLVVDINYLQRSLIPGLQASLKPGGWIVFETFLIDQQTIGHPKNPDYLLAHNELLGWFRGFRVRYYREGKTAEDGEAAFRAGLLAQKIG